jgi:hypothetical protein
VRGLASVLKVAGGISIGVGIGQQWARLELDRYYRQKGEEFVSQQYRAMQTAWMDREPAETPVETEFDLMATEVPGDENLAGSYDGPDTSSDAIVVGGEAILAEQAQAYIQQAAEYAGPTMLDGISYITEDEYGDEDDGFAKEQITIYLQAGNEEPIFVNGGDTITNWAELIGETILVDFFRLIPPQETERVLYVRNHGRSEDYEVFQAMG